MCKNKILVVEDEFSINDALTFTLRKEGYEVKSAYTKAETFKLLDSFNPEMVLLDVMLPDGDGFEICREISNNLFVIMLTARDNTIDRILGVEIGADDYITKPFEIREVTARIKAIFRRANKFNNICNDGIYIDSHNRIVKINGEKVDFKRKEFDLLEFLNNNRNKVYTREQLLDNVWGYDFEGEIRTVDVHIRRIRSKLGEEWNGGKIETVFGVGYVMR